MEKINNLSLPATILMGAVLLGGFYYAVQAKKQESVEIQQRVELQAKKESDEKNYIVKQKSACLDIYQTESKKWNNVTGWNYNEATDKCEIIYREQNKKTKAECDKILSNLKKTYENDLIPPYLFSIYLHCVDGTFVTEF